LWFAPDSSGNPQGHTQRQYLDQYWNARPRISATSRTAVLPSENKVEDMNAIMGAMTLPVEYFTNSNSPDRLARFFGGFIAATLSLFSQPVARARSALRAPFRGAVFARRPERNQCLTRCLLMHPTPRKPGLWLYAAIASRNSISNPQTAASCAGISI
jgi:hypothetical protein